MNLSDLNSATKYPSIPTYHVLGGKGRLTEEVGVKFTGPVSVTEKVDGTNGRIVLLPGGDYYLGSREELIYAKGDRIENPILGIVAALKATAERLAMEASPARDAAALPRTLVGGWELLADHVLGSCTRCPLDGSPLWLGRAEGLVLRSADRRQIAKMRVEDYGKTLGMAWR